MRRTGILTALGLVLALALAGCGQSRPAATQPSAAAGGQATGGAAPVWQGNGAWNRLAKLGDYAYKTTIVTGGTGQKNGVVVFEGYYYSPTQYRMVINPGAAGQLTLLRAGDGHYYMVTSQGAYDLGTTPGAGAYGSMFNLYSMEAANAWGGIFAGSSGTYTGPATVAGRPADSFRVAAVQAAGGVSEKVSGTAAVDVATGAPLTSDFKWSLTGNGKTASFEDSMQVTGVGDVPPVSPPAGSKPAPGYGG